MSGAKLGTHIDKPYNQQPDTRAAAANYLRRTGNGDVLEILGLAEERPQSPTCSVCGKPLKRTTPGGYRPCQRRQCIEATP